LPSFGKFLRRDIRQQHGTQWVGALFHVKRFAASVRAAIRKELACIIGAGYDPNAIISLS
jgi:hypothetical protein